MTTSKSRYHNKADADGSARRQRSRRKSHPDVRSIQALPFMDTAQHHNPDSNAIAEYVERASTIRKHDIHTFKLVDKLYVMKFTRPVDRTRRRVWASAALCAVLFGKFPSPSKLLPGGVGHEARRLQKLRMQGVRVPQVYAVTDDHIVLEHCGETVEKYLKIMPPQQRTRLLWDVVNDLAEFHGAGHWHGGAQVRNLTLKNGAIYRIDFEEHIGAALPLPLAQAFDVLLAFNSMIDHLHEDQEKLGVQLLTHYLDHMDSEQIIQSLKKLERWLSYLRRIEPHLAYRLRKKRDLQRTRKFAWILSGALMPYHKDGTRRIA